MEWLSIMPITQPTSAVATSYENASGDLHARLIKTNVTEVSSVKSAGFHSGSRNGS